MSGFFSRCVPFISTSSIDPSVFSTKKSGTYVLNLFQMMHFRLPKEANLVLCKQESPHADFDLDRALVNYNVIDGDVLLLKEV